MLLEIVPHLFAGNVDPVEVSESRLPVQRLRYRELDLLEEFTQQDKSAARCKWLLSRLVPTYVYRNEILCNYLPDVFNRNKNPLNQLEYDVYGSSIIQEKSRSDEAVEFVLENLKRYTDGFRINDKLCEALRETLTLCRSHAVPAALVVMPVSPEYCRSYPPNAWNEADAFTHDVALEFKVPLISAWEWIPEDDFFDSHHLLLSGAKRFSERFAREALPALLLPATPSSDMPLELIAPRDNQPQRVIAARSTRNIH